LVWGASWFLGSIALLGAVLPVFGVSYPWPSILAISINIGVTGIIVGGVFSGVLRLFYRNKPLLGIDPKKAALHGAILAGVISPLLGTLIRLPTSVSMAISDFLAVGSFAATLGAIAAGGTIAVAQRSARELTSGAAAELEAEQADVEKILEGGSI